MTDPMSLPPQMGVLYDVLKDIRDDLPARKPAVVTTFVPPMGSGCEKFVWNGVEHTVLQLAVWSTGSVTPIYRVPGRGHIRTVDPDESWHFSLSEEEGGFGSYDLPQFDDN